MITIPLSVVVVGTPPSITDAYIPEIVGAANRSDFFRGASIALGRPTIRHAPDTQHAGTALAVVTDQSHHARMTDRAQEQTINQLAGRGGRLLRLVLVSQFNSAGAPLGPAAVLGFTKPKIVSGAVSSDPAAGRMVLRTDPISHEDSTPVRLLRFAQLLMHETGHALGLTHDHENDVLNVMHHTVGHQHTRVDRAQMDSAHRGAQLLATAR